MSKVFVLDETLQPLNPVRPARARILLSSGKAAVYRTYPFTLILQKRGDRWYILHDHTSSDPRP